MNIIEPMLYESADPESIEEFIKDPNWIMQQKVDGMRCMVILTPTTEPIFITRNGQHLKSAAAKLHFPGIKEALEPMRQGICVEDDVVLYLDGELMTDTGDFVLFDMPVYSEDGLPLKDRLILLNKDLKKYPHPKLSMVYTAYTEYEKHNLFVSIKEIGGEGVIAKLSDSLYHPGQRARHSLKLKFSQTVDCVVIDVNRGQSTKSKKGGDKSNYILGLFNNDNTLIEISNVSGIGREPLSIGDVVEVEYLYVGAGGRLVQPRIIKPRPDKRAKDCSTNQLRFVSKVVLPNH